MTGKRAFGCVFRHMRGYRTLASKFALTVVAVKNPTARVEFQSMHRQRRGRRVLFATILTLIWFPAFALMHGNVFFPGGRAEKRQTAILTLERFFFEMEPAVVGQIALCAEIFGANIATIRPTAAMLRSVLSQFGRVDEDHFAEFALERTVLLVLDLVRAQFPFRLEPRVALAARDVFLCVRFYMPLYGYVIGTYFVANLTAEPVRPAVRRYVIQKISLERITGLAKHAGKLMHAMNDALMLCDAVLDSETSTA